MPRQYTSTPAVERFWKHVDKSGECWIWTAYRDRRGYGRFYPLDTRRNPIPASRYSWELAYGPIPDGLWVLHKCDNPPCVNPSHLFLGTHADNMRDATAKGRQAHGEGVAGARLTEDDVRTIRNRYAAGDVSQQSIADEYGISQSSVSFIVHRETWKHVA